MEHKNTCTLYSSINDSDIALSSTISVHNRPGINVVGVVFSYPWCEGGRRVDLELCFAKWFDECSWKYQEFIATLLLKF